MYNSSCPIVQSIEPSTLCSNPKPRLYRVIYQTVQCIFRQTKFSFSVSLKVNPIKAIEAILRGNPYNTSLVNSYTYNIIVR